MLCESCRAGDPECHAWIACERQAEVRQGLTDFGDVAEVDPRCPLVYEVGYDEDDPYTEPRRVLVCEVHP